MSPAKKATNARKRNTGSGEKRAISQTASSPPDPSPIALGKGIGLYLEECRAGGPASRGVALGSLPDFPPFTEDPVIIERAIAYYEAKLPDAPTALKELALHQRIRNLRVALNGQGDTPTSHRDFFVQHAAKFAAARGFDYETFRTMGVPADVLRDAGIARGARASAPTTNRTSRTYSPEVLAKFRENAANARDAKARKEAALRATATRKTAKKRAAKKKTTKKTAKRR